MKGFEIKTKEEIKKMKLADVYEYENTLKGLAGDLRLAHLELQTATAQVKSRLHTANSLSK